VPGVQICEHFPLQAKMWDKLAAIRSIVSVDEHSDTLVMTGWSDNQNRIRQSPSFGAYVSKIRGNNSDVPPFVSLRGMSRGTEPKSRERYKGIEGMLTARRLVESGVGCVTLTYGGWDTHGQNFVQLKRQLPVLDRGISSLIQDLHDRGMQNDVVLVVWGEFGRT